MAHITADRVRETTTTTGTGTVTLAGAVAGFRTFSSVMATSDTCYYFIGAGSEWEVGLGTLASSTTLARTTRLSSSTGASVSFSAGTKDVFLTLAADRTYTLDAGLTAVLPVIVTEPTAPADGFLRLYAKKIAQKHFLKTVGPSGVDSPLQNALFQNRVTMYVPSTGTTGTGSGTGLGPVWTSGGTVTTPTPSSTSPAISNQMRRTRYANIVTTTNQTLGLRTGAADSNSYWRGNAAGLGGFFFAARFIVELYPASTVRIFAGLSSSTSTYTVASDTMLNDSCGLWHDTTDPSSGANSFNFVTRNTATTTKQSIALSNAIAAGNSYDFYMFCPPNGSTIYWRLDDIVNGVTYEGNTATTLPTSTAFLGPQCAMSNGTANVTVTTSAIGVAGVYVESDR